jgi:hypothetical protein
MTVQVENGHIRISFGDEPEQLTIDEASQLIADLGAAVAECERQQEQIRAACAGGHVWGSGYNAVKLGDGAKVVVQWCTRDGCQGRRELPGWMEFAPQLHIELYTGRQLDCYGPGCENCAAEAVGKAVRKMFAKIGPALDGLLKVEP